jgi:hypothetical protein
VTRFCSSEVADVTDCIAATHPVPAEPGHPLLLRCAQPGFSANAFRADDVTDTRGYSVGSTSAVLIVETVVARWAAISRAKGVAARRIARRGPLGGIP